MLRAALAEAEAEAARAEADAAEVAQRRAGLLLTASEPELDAIDRELQQAQRVADRGTMATAALREKLAAAEQRERQDQLDALYATGEGHLARGLELFNIPSLYRTDHAA